MDTGRLLRRGLTLVLAGVLLGAVLPGVALAEVQVAHLQRIDLSLDRVTANSGSVTEGSARSGVAGEAVGVAPFDLIALSWTGDLPGATLEVRRDGRWESVDTAVDPSGPDRGSAESEGAPGRRYSEPTWVGSADGYRVTADGSGRAAGVEVLVVRQQTELRPTVATPAAGADPISPGPQINPRTAWGAAAPRGGADVAIALSFAVIHHTDTSNSYGPGDVPAILRSIQAFHQQGRGWSDIGYNFLVDRFGQAWEGRAGGITRPVIGAHAAGFNTGSVGISLIGDMTTTTPTAAMIDTAGRLVGWKLAQHGVDPNGSMIITSNGGSKYPDRTVLLLPRVIGHRDVGSTGCPGSAYGSLGTIRQIAASTYHSEVAGSFDAVRADLNRITVSGWALAPGRTDQLTVRMVVSGTQRAAATATVNRPDVGAAYPTEGAAHGFVFDAIVPDGFYEVCLYAAHPDLDTNNLLGCNHVTVRGDPLGSLDEVGFSSGSATVRGWVARVGVTQVVQVRVTVDGGTVAGPVNAELNRPDVAAAVPGVGPAHGYLLTVAVPPAGGRVCVDVQNPDIGTWTNVGCQGSRSLGPQPLGSLDAVARVPGGVAFSGWALDPDVAEPARVHVYLNGLWAMEVVADGSRPDVGAAFPGYGEGHGFSSSFGPVRPGPVTVCAYAINRGPGSNVWLGCRTLIVTSDPVGSLDAVARVPGGVAFSGWALDPDVAGPIRVHVYLNGVWAMEVVADGSRPDVGAAFPGYGEGHGFSSSFGPVGPGPVTVCAYAIGEGPGTNPLLGCRRV